MISRFGLVFILTMIAGCGVQVYNSSTGDKAVFGHAVVGDSTAGGQRLAAAYTVFQNNCFTCHSDFSTYTTDQAWINAGYVVADDLTGSELFQHLKGSEVPGPHDMPQSPHAALSSDDLSTVRDWIGQIGE